jgi:hypothetical protein
MLNPIAIIKQDHAKIKELFDSYGKLDTASHDAKKELAHKILKELTIHARMEEKYFYPKLKEAINKDHPVPVDEAIAEHHAAKVLILELKIMPVASETYDARMDVLEENIMHHIEEEETELLPEAETLLAGHLDEIGRNMDDYRQNARKSLLDKILGE